MADRFKRKAVHNDPSPKARGYDQLRWKAEADASDAFLVLAESAGKMTEASLDQLATLLEIMWGINEKKGGDA